MAIVIESDGVMRCAALHKPNQNHLYIDDNLHYELSVVKGMVVSRPYPQHNVDNRWFFANDKNKPTDCDMGFAK